MPPVVIFWDNSPGVTAWGFREVVVTMCHHHRVVSGGCSGGVLREECAGACGVHGSGRDSPPDVGEASGDGFGCG